MHTPFASTEWLLVFCRRKSESSVATAKEVSETLGCSAEAARQKLLEPRDQGIVTRRQVGAGAVVWWLVADYPSPEDARNIDPDDTDEP